MKYSLYRHFDAHGQLLYIGISKNINRRLREHRYHAVWFKDIAEVEIVASFDTRDEASQAEREAIQRERPLHNIRDTIEVLRIRAARARRHVVITSYVPREIRDGLAMASVCSGRSRQEIMIEALREWLVRQPANETGITATSATSP